jgi:hypothetical protein
VLGVVVDDIVMVEGVFQGVLNVLEETGLNKGGGGGINARFALVESCDMS